MAPPKKKHQTGKPHLTWAEWVLSFMECRSSLIAPLPEDLPARVGFSPELDWSLRLFYWRDTLRLHGTSLMPCMISCPMASGSKRCRTSFRARKNQSCLFFATSPPSRSASRWCRRPRLAVQICSGARFRWSRLKPRSRCGGPRGAVADLVGTGATSRLETHDGKKTVCRKPGL